ncbi:MAG: sulfatase-like hydrolase/transferase, partial [Actinomycetia bacterium]|nr:sulfatase-like hydrolase/transferase [Actinomycetes bacterium]
MITAHQTSSPGSKFFTYLAFGATHSPHQAPAEYVEKYQGRYDDGWDAVRQRWFENQLDLGVVPEGTELAPRNPGVQPWDDLSADRQALYARMQETFAGFLDHTDDQIGRLIDFLQSLEVLDDTLIMLVSDNGASQEGGRNGTLNELAYFNLIRTSVEDMVDRLDEIGGPNIYNNYPWGWAQVGNTPLRYYKQNTYEGGIRDPFIVHWPNGISDAGGLRNQYHHVSDVLPTVLDCLGVEAPTVHNGIEQQPVEGMSLRYTFDSVDTPTRKQSQYYEMLGHRGIWADGWKAVTMHERGTSFDDDHWALYHTDRDFSECHDLAADEPDKLRQLVDRWWVDAGRYNVLPLDDRSGAELMVIRRPGSAPPGDRQRFWPSTPHLERTKTPDVRNRSFEIMATFARDRGHDGVLVASGARTGGYALFVQDERLVFTYNRLGAITEVRSTVEVGAGEVVAGVRYTKTGEHQGTVTLVVNGDDAGSFEIETLPYRQTLYGMDIGRDLGPTVSDSYEGPFTFAGTLRHIDYVLDNDRADLQRAAQVEFQNSLADQ